MNHSPGSADPSFVFEFIDIGRSARDVHRQGPMKARLARARRIP